MRRAPISRVERVSGMRRIRDDRPGRRPATTRIGTCPSRPASPSGPSSMFAAAADAGIEAPPQVPHHAEVVLVGVGDDERDVRTHQRRRPGTAPDCDAHPACSNMTPQSTAPSAPRGGRR